MKRDQIPAGQVDWTRLLGRTLLTSKGARFTVVKVTTKGISVRPERASRTYSVSIPRELERVVAELAAGTFFPSPSNLVKVGVRSEYSSYAWGILHAVLIDHILGDAPHPARPKSVQATDFVGSWRITSMPNFEHEWLVEGNEPAQITLAATKYGTFDGTYSFNYCQGSIEGAIREFGGETLLLFGFDGSDEMDPASGAGWVRLIRADQLAGEFLNDYGEFCALRARTGASRKRARYEAIHWDEDEDEDEEDDEEDDED